MSEADKRGDEVESAGETTAADTVSGPPDTAPVGAETMVKVSDSPAGEPRAEDETGGS